MSLLTPDFGLLFWMIVSFLIVLGLLWKFGFPIITKSVNERKAYIQDSLDAAQKANEQLKTVKQQSEAILADAKIEQVKILKAAADTRDRIIEEARVQAQFTGQKELAAIRLQIQAEKEQAIKDVHVQIAELSVQVAQKILRESLKNPKEQMSMIDRLVDEALVTKS